MLPIDDNDAFRIRANAGDGPDCDVNPIVPIPLSAPIVDGIPCDDPPEPEEETFFQPGTAPVVDRRVNLPAPLTIYSPELPLACPEGTVEEPPGGAEFIAFGSLTRRINFSDVTLSGAPLFSQTTLYNLAKVSPAIQAVVEDFLGESAPSVEPDRGDYITAGLAARVTEIVGITKLSRATVEALWDYILTQQADLDLSTEEFASRQLSCGFLNEDLWVVCYDRVTGDNNVVYVDPGVLDPPAVPVAAGTIFSPVSQNEANRLAIQTAADIPTCLVSNEPQEVTCEDLFGGDYDESIAFEWPTLDDATTTLEGIGGIVVLDEDGEKDVGASTTGWIAPIYNDVADLGGDAVPRELIIRVEIPAGVVEAATQEEANEQARAIAITYLDCFIPSRERELKCTDSIVSSAAHARVAELLPDILPEFYPVPFADLGVATAAATAAAVEAALSEIATGYTNLAHILPTVSPDNVTFIGGGTAIDERISVRLVVPAGAFVGESRQSADASAYGFALASAASKLDCNWKSRDVTYACDDAVANNAPSLHLTDELYVTDGADGETYPGPYNWAFKRGQDVVLPTYEDDPVSGLVEMLASVEKSDPYFFEAPRGSFISPNSQEAADRIAAAHAMSQLSCVYCNPQILANCPPDGEFTLPLDPEDTPGYSYDATRGAPGLVYVYNDLVIPPRWQLPAESGEVLQVDPITWLCSTDPADVVRVAEETGTQVLRSQDVAVECRFCNDYITAACCQPVGEPAVDYPKFTTEEECDALAAAFDEFVTSGCDGSGVSDPYVVIAIPKCSIFAESVIEANNLAKGIAWAQLECLFGNVEKNGTCETDGCAGLGDPLTVEVSGVTYTGVQGACNFVGTSESVIGAGIYRSSCSQEQADAQAQAAADALLVCLWTNNEQTACCPTTVNIFHSSAVTCVTIPEGIIVTDEGTVHANELALKLAVMQLYCVYTNEIQCSGCGILGEPRGYTAADNAGTQHSNVCLGEELSDESPGGVCIEQDTIITTISTDHANLLARNLAYVGPCIWCSNPAAVVCEDKGRPHPTAILAAAVDFCEVEATVLCQASEIAFRMAVAKLICLWSNNAQFAIDCPPGFTLIAGGVVWEDTIIAPTTDVADQIAKGIAESAKVCKQDFFGNGAAINISCPGDENAPNNNRYELETAGVVAADTIFTTTPGLSDDIAEAIARAETVCRPVRRCNSSAYGGHLCTDQVPEKAICHEGAIGGTDLCSYGLTQDEIQAVAQAFADANTVCCPTKTYNEECTGYKDCGDAGQCVYGTVAAGSFVSYNDDPEAGAEEVQAIAQAVANAQSMCCPPVTYNEAQSGVKTCAPGDVMCVEGQVAAGSIPSWLEDPLAALAEANAIAKGIADATSVCCPEAFEDGVDATLTIIDCSGANVLTMIFTQGILTTFGPTPVVEVQAGCDGTIISTSPPI